MKTSTLFLLLAALLPAPLASGGDSPLPNRWVFVHGKSLARPADVDKILHIARTGAEHGLNGMVLGASFDRLDRQDKKYFVGLERLKKSCGELGVEIIPLVFSPGFGSTLSHDPNLATGLPVRNQLFVAEAGEAHFVSDAPVKLINGGLEKTKKGKLLSIRARGQLGRSPSRRQPRFPRR